MEMLEAMRKCAPIGYVIRKAYPNRKYYKDENGIFPDAANVDYIDFLARDWECCPADNEGFRFCRFNWPREVRNQTR